MSEKKKTTKRGEYSPHIQPENAPPCDGEGCAQAGVYKAPKSRDELHEYRWFCLDHIREHNAKWDYFAGCERDEIEDFIKESMTGHRPTWERESRISSRYNQLQDALYEFLHLGRKTPSSPAPVKAKIRKALAVINLTYPYTEQELKIQYRTMVKKHHPDMNKGDKRSEEVFKQVAVAYHTLLEHLQNPT